MIDLKKFEKKKTTKPAGELTPNDVGSLVKVIDIDGCEITDVMFGFIAGDWGRRRDIPEDLVQIDLAHVGTYSDEGYRGRGSVRTSVGMRVVVQRPISTP